MSVITRAHWTAGAVLTIAAAAAAAAERPEIPEGFGIGSSKQAEKVNYLRKTERDYALVRLWRDLPKICSLTPGSTADFGPGADEPVRTSTHTFVSEDLQRIVEYRRVDFYNCVKEELKLKGNCNCSYRRQTRYSVVLQIGPAGRAQRWEADLSAGTGRHYVDMPLPSWVRRKHMNPDDYPQTGVVTGTDKVAGLACATRHVETPTSRLDACMSLRDPALPPMFWDLNIKNFNEHLDEKEGGWFTLRSGELEAWALRTVIDSAVFEVPSRVTFKEMPGAASKGTP